MTTEIAELVVKLGVDADSAAVKDLDDSMKGVDSSTGGARKAFGKFAKGVAVVGAVAAGAVVSLVKMADSTANAGDQIAKSSRAAGVSAEAYQRQRFALDLAGVSQSAYEKGTKKIAQELERARQGEVTPFTKAITAAGGSLDDFGDNADDNLPTLIGILGEVDDASQRTALLAEALGAKVGPEFATAVIQGKEALEAAGLTLNTVYTAEQLKNAEDYVDAQAEMKDAINSVKVSMSAGLLPTLIDGIDQITNWVEENEELIQQDIPAFIDDLTEKVEDLVGFSAELAEETANLGREFDLATEEGTGLGDAMSGIASEAAGLTAAYDDLTTSIGNALEEFLGFENAQKVKSELKDAAGRATFGLGPIFGGIIDSFVDTEGRQTEKTAVQRQQKETENEDKAAEERKARREESREDRAAKKRKRTERQVSSAQGAIGKAEASKRATGKQKTQLAGIRNQLNAGEISPSEARSAVAAVGVSQGGGRRGGGKKKKEGPTDAELIDAAAQGRSSVGGVQAPRPNVAISIQTTINMDNTFNVTEGTGEELARVTVGEIQKQINRSNVEASRVIQPVVLR